MHAILNSLVICVTCASLLPGAGAAVTTSQAVLLAQTQSKASKKINYDALKVRRHVIQC